MSERAPAKDGDRLARLGKARSEDQQPGEYSQDDGHDGEGLVAASTCADIGAVSESKNGRTR